MLKRVFAGELFPSAVDVGVLVLRVVAGVSLFLRHGVEKLAHFSAMSGHFPDPIHIGAVPSLVVALISDSICSLLVAAGLATRWAALFCFCTIAVAWAFVHQFQFLGPKGDHGELMVVYLGCMAAVFLVGGRRFSLDHLLVRGRSGE
jgi:putative oxidoreductase